MKINPIIKNNHDETVEQIPSNIFQPVDAY